MTSTKIDRVPRRRFKLHLMGPAPYGCTYHTADRADAARMVAAGWRLYRINEIPRHYWEPTVTTTPNTDARDDILAARPGIGRTLRQACRAQERDLLVGASGRVYEITRRVAGKGTLGLALTYGAEGEWFRVSVDLPSDAMVDVR